MQWTNPQNIARYYFERESGRLYLKVYWNSTMNTESPPLRNETNRRDAIFQLHLTYYIDLNPYNKLTKWWPIEEIIIQYRIIYWMSFWNEMCVNVIWTVCATFDHARTYRVCTWLQEWILESTIHEFSFSSVKILCKTYKWVIYISTML